MAKKSKDKDDSVVKSVNWLMNTTYDDMGLSDTNFGYSIGKRDVFIKGFISVIYSAITLIAKTISMSNFTLFKNGKEVKSKSDYVYRLLMKPNPFMDWYDFVFLAQVMLEISGERYIYLAKDKVISKIVREMWVIPSFAIQPKFKQINNSLIDYTNIEGYIENIDSTKSRLYNPNEIVFDYYPSPTKMNRGDSPLAKMAVEIDIHKFAKRYIKNFYRNSAIPNGMLVLKDSKAKISDDNKNEIRRNAWNSEYQGVNKSNKIAILTGDWDFIKTSIPPTEDFINQAIWAMKNALTVFNIPPIFLNEFGNVNRNTAVIQERMFLRNCIKPRLTKLESLFNNKIFPQIVSKGEYNLTFDNPVPDDDLVKIQKAKEGATFGVITVDEMRQLLGFKPLNNEKGKEMITPLNQPNGKPSDNVSNNNKSINKEFNEFIQLENGLKSLLEDK